MGKKLVFLFVLFLILGGCTRDDICPEETPTTPLLVINFKDITNRLIAKEVENLSVFLNTADSTLINGPITDTIVRLPLNTEANTTSFLFAINSNSEDVNYDLISFTYTNEEVYINRACGFKNFYNEFFVAVQDEPLNENWIINFEILQNTVQNQDEAHLTIFH